MNWRNSLRHERPEVIIEKASSWPRTNSRFSQTTAIFLRSNMPNEALSVASRNSEFDQNNYSAWYYIYNISGENTVRQNAKENLRRLDPRNAAYK